jgi:restriction system protein
MSIPDYQTLMLPLLRFASDKSEHSAHEATTALAEKFSLNETQLQELLPSGKQTIFRNRVGWARTYLSKAGLLESSKRGFFQIS